MGNYPGWSDLLKPSNKNEPIKTLQPNEKDFQSTVVQLAKQFGWRVYHTWNSFRSTEGFPDLVMLRRERLIVAELKSEKGKVRDNQNQWLSDFEKVSCVEVHLWRPSDFEAIEKTLR